MNILALVPARGGSERIHKKNIRPLCGKPLIAYTVEGARRSRHTTRVLVSTDSQEIAGIARQYGAEVPFLRPAEIAQASSTELEFLEHTLAWLKTHEQYEPELVVLLYPTSPLRKAESIDRAIEQILAHPEADSLRSVTRCAQHPYKMWIRDGDYLKPFVPLPNTGGHTLSYQLLPEVFVQNASIYITRPSTIFQKGSPVGDAVIPFFMDKEESIDINHELDFVLAEYVLANQAAS